ncbi:MAG: Ig-like domain-containing protein [Firmicutes bacterium]|nr:Ig-like domain-containing protein [Bacillota bacterium]
MKKSFTIIMALMIVFSFTINALAIDYVNALYTDIRFKADGRCVNVETYNINNYGYYKLRDIAAMAAGTDKEFSVTWDPTQNMITLTAGGEYTPSAADLQPGDAKSKKALPNAASLVINGQKVDFVAYNINNFTYFKLRDICQALDIGVVWDESSRTSGIATKLSYEATQPYFVAPVSLKIKDVDVSRSYTSTSLYIGQSTFLDAELSPANAGSGIIWSSSDASIASVDGYGKVTAHKTGTVTITAMTYNDKSDTFTIKVPQAAAELQYQMNTDKTGYIITGCDTDAYTAHIPASYNGLPVVAIHEKAFMNCSSLRYFTVDEEQGIFYEEGGVIFTDIPHKTLVCFPPDYDAATYYYAPEDTKAVASYAFAGLKALETLTFHEGLQSIGDSIFYKINDKEHVNLRVYMPDSLTDIGSYLMQGQSRNVAFYAHDDTAILKYARDNEIPAGIISDFHGDETSVELSAPASLPAEQMFPAAEKSRKYYNDTAALTYYTYSWGFDTTIDISALQKTHSGEIYITLDHVWSNICADPYGNTEFNASAQTGLYGAGYTEGEAILRGYDKQGKLIAMQYVSGDFAFAFPGAFNLGIEKGSNTQLTVIPVEPVFVASSGAYNLDPTQWYHTHPHGDLMQYFVLQIPYAVFTQQFSMDTNLLTYNFFDATNGESITLGSYCTPHYVIGRTTLEEVMKAEEMSAVSFIFDKLECLWEDENLKCMISGSLGQTEEFGQKASDLLKRAKQVMVGTYFPADAPIGQIIIDSTSSWSPVASEGNIHLPEDVVRDFSELTIAHEMVHAIDQQIPAMAHNKYAPTPWYEGRAEYLSRLILNENGAPNDFDWSFLSEEDKADFFHYYYYSTNRTTEYDVGHHFFYYLLQTYGENVSAKIMANIAALPEIDPIVQVSDEKQEEYAQMFKQCIEAATEVGVFQNFVRDVINK